MKTIKLLIGVLFLSTGATAQFQECNSPTTKDLWDVFFIDAEIGVAVGDSGVIIRSTDGGLNWNLVMTNDTLSFRKVRFFDNQNGIAVGSDIYTTNDGGQTWDSQHMANNYIDMAILNDSTCIVSGWPVAIMKSLDKGLTWDTLITENVNQEFGLLSFIDDFIGFSCHYGGGSIDKTLKTIDGGYNWAIIDAQTGSDNSVIEALSFVSENKGFRAGWYNPHLMKTTDSGNNWTYITYTDSTFWGQLLDLHISKDQPYSYYGCGWYGNIIRSNDGGNTWELLDSPVSSTTSLFGIYFINDLVGWIVGGDGTILKTTNGGGPLGVANLKNNPFLKIYPNPTSGTIHIEKKEAIQIHSIKILNAAGQTLFETENTQNLNISRQAPGSYFILIETDKGDFVETIIKE